MNEKKLEAIKLTVEVANKVLQYLSTKPYGEVAELIAEIQKSEPIYHQEETKI